ncbi:MAG: hypothetical protein LRZ99_03415 [Desulfotomaculum sp.]|nr:hypothetical protein [Desulfotomaculum sp.]
MSLAVEKIFEEFEALALPEKIAFIKKVIGETNGKWVTINNKIIFTPDNNKELTPAEITIIETGKAEIARGEWTDWDDLKKELRF